MSWPARRTQPPGGPLRGLACLALVVLLVAGAIGWLFAPAPAQAARLNGAGLVVRHGDGRVVYVYVEFNEPTITGEDLLLRAGLALETAPFAGQGLGVCSLDGEGCPASDCFCKSYGNPSLYWVYFRLTPDGGWASQPIGPGNRVIQDGDVDGWSWSSGPANLPATSIDEIARINGVDRKPPEPEPTPTPTPPPPPAPTQAPEPTATAVPTPTPTPTQPPPAVTAPAAAAPTPTKTTPLEPTLEPTATAAATMTPAPTPTGTPVTPTATVAPSLSPMPTTAGTPIVRAVEVDSSGTARPLDPVDDADSGGFDAGSYAPFAAIFLGILGVGGWVIYQRRGRGGP